MYQLVYYAGCVSLCCLLDLEIIPSPNVPDFFCSYYEVHAQRCPVCALRANRGRQTPYHLGKENLNLLAVWGLFFCQS